MCHPSGNSDIGTSSNKQILNNIKQSLNYCILNSMLFCWFFQHLPVSAEAHSSRVSRAVTRSLMPLLTWFPGLPSWTHCAGNAWKIQHDGSWMIYTIIYYIHNILYGRSGAHVLLVLYHHVPPVNFIERSISRHIQAIILKCARCNVWSKGRCHNKLHKKRMQVRIATIACACAKNGRLLSIRSMECLYYVK